MTGQAEILIRAFLEMRRHGGKQDAGVREMKRDCIGLTPRRRGAGEGERGGFIDLANPLPYIPNYFSLVLSRQPRLVLSLASNFLSFVQPPTPNRLFNLLFLSRYTRPKNLFSSRPIFYLLFFSSHLIWQEFLEKMLLFKNIQLCIPSEFNS